ncbi:alpha/beta hydrolase [Ruminococcus albus]|uniref:Phosphoglycolate phosphatase n=1 Tax=Ruminococcus albus TaxID=1264 RepID=A0A1H7IPF5_RUMAL|nr:alpha/beta hydrolase [Ruminococcus albus]SEK63762.1 phosphoglycolate phosphatase [Ruminococcus albus]
MKLCVLFPGIGYHCEKPLLYYSAKLARSKGYDVIPLKFSGFDNTTKGNEEKMSRAADHALALASEQLSVIDFSQYEKVVFIGKSIGTIACLAYRETSGINASCILLTPLEATFESLSHRCTAFHGTSDPWADTEAIRKLCRKHLVPLNEYNGANHSLETGDTFTDIQTVLDVTEKIDALL